MCNEWSAEILLSRDFSYSQLNSCSNLKGSNFAKLHPCEITELSPYNDNDNDNDNNNVLKRRIYRAQCALQ